MIKEEENNSNKQSRDSNHELSNIFEPNGIESLQEDEIFEGYIWEAQFADKQNEFSNQVNDLDNFSYKSNKFITEPDAAEPKYKLNDIGNIKLESADLMQLTKVSFSNNHQIDYPNSPTPTPNYSRPIISANKVHDLEKQNVFIVGRKLNNDDMELSASPKCYHKLEKTTSAKNDYSNLNVNIMDEHNNNYNNNKSSMIKQDTSVAYLNELGYIANNVMLLHNKPHIKKLRKRNNIADNERNTKSKVDVNHTRIDIRPNTNMISFNHLNTSSNEIPKTVDFSHPRKYYNNNINNDNGMNKTNMHEVKKHHLLNKKIINDEMTRAKSQPRPGKRVSQIGSFRNTALRYGRKIIFGYSYLDDSVDQGINTSAYYKQLMTKIPLAEKKQMSFVEMSHRVMPGIPQTNNNTNFEKFVNAKFGPFNQEKASTKGPDEDQTMLNHFKMICPYKVDLENTADLNILGTNLSEIAKMNTFLELEEQIKRNKNKEKTEMMKKTLPRIPKKGHTTNIVKNDNIANKSSNERLLSPLPNRTIMMVLSPSTGLPTEQLEKDMVAKGKELSQKIYNNIRQSIVSSNGAARALG